MRFANKEDTVAAVATLDKDSAVSEPTAPTDAETAEAEVAAETPKESDEKAF